MDKIRFPWRLFACIALTLTFNLAARAQATRTWVSGVGDDVNPCSRTAPCKTFAGAISKTATGGEISTLDPGGFGTVTITKSITIDGTGSLSSILAASTTGININITAPGDTAKTVRLRGLSINGAGTGTHGIRVVAANKVSVEDSVIDGFTVNGVTIDTGDVFLANSSIRNNAGAGIAVAPRGARVGLSRVNVVFNGTSVSGPPGALISFGDVVLFGNNTGDPARRE